MDSRDLIRRAENALRTGQTENLFPVLARRLEQALQEEAWERHRDLVRARLRREAIDQARFFRENPDVLDQIMHTYAEALKPTLAAVQSLWDQIREAFQPAVEMALKAMQNMPAQSDFALVPAPLDLKPSYRPQGYAPLGYAGPAFPHYSLNPHTRPYRRNQ